MILWKKLFTFLLRISDILNFAISYFCIIDWVDSWLFRTWYRLRVDLYGIIFIFSFSGFYSFRVFLAWRRFLFRLSTLIFRFSLGYLTSFFFLFRFAFNFFLSYCFWTGLLRWRVSFLGTDSLLISLDVWGRLHILAF